MSKRFGCIAQTTYLCIVNVANLLVFAKMSTLICSHLIAALHLKLEIWSS